jgi:hypothetical protein
MSQNMSLVGGVSYSSCAGYQILNSLYQVDVSGVNPNGVNESSRFGGFVVYDRPRHERQEYL